MVTQTLAQPDDLRVKSDAGRRSDAKEGRFEAGLAGRAGRPEVCRESAGRSLLLLPAGVILYDYPGRKRREDDYQVWEVAQRLEDMQNNRDSINRAFEQSVPIPFGGGGGAPLAPEMPLFVS